MEHEKLTFIFLGTFLFLSLSFLSLLFYYDPLKIFHKPWINQTYLQSNMRQQAAGIINNKEYDSIILGTSMLECTSAKEASNTLGGKFINISLSGSSFFERAVILKYALSHHKLHKVLYSLDEKGLVSMLEGRKNGDYVLSNWDYLYDNNPLNDFQAYINTHYLKCIFTEKELSSCRGSELNIDKPNSWQNDLNEARKFGGISHWFSEQDSQQAKNAFQKIYYTLKKIKRGEKNIDPNVIAKINNDKKYIDNNIIKYVQRYKKTEFILVLPPYSRIKYAMEAQYNVSYFKIRKSAIRYLVKLSSIYPNLKIYGWGNHSFVDDIKNYKDLGHYSYKINSWMLTAIEKEEGHLTTQNIDKYLDTFTQKALLYNLKPFREQLRQYLSSYK